MVPDRTNHTVVRPRALVGIAASCLLLLLGADPVMGQAGGIDAPPDPSAPPPPPTPVAGSFVFPVQGVHSYGSAGARFGAGRGGRVHQGQDVFAACGTSLVAVTNTKVLLTGYQRLAGNYLVLRYKRMRHDYMYAHLATAPLVTKGMKLAPGQQVGTVGDTGNASGCHLHFELWKRPGWYRGGRAIDPLPTLLAWDPSF
jgi:murein DD-endopeptidase MepM/ murein hydrolase activator NlpD